MHTPCPRCDEPVDAEPFTIQVRQTIPCPSCGGAITRLNRDDWIFLPGVRFFAYPAAVLVARTRPELLTEEEAWLLGFLFDADGKLLRDRREEAGEHLGLTHHGLYALMFGALARANPKRPAAH